VAEAVHGGTADFLVVGDGEVDEGSEGAGQHLGDEGKRRGQEAVQLRPMAPTFF
jgi:hypothetical protein